VLQRSSRETEIFFRVWFKDFDWRFVTFFKIIWSSKIEYGIALTPARRFFLGSFEGEWVLKDSCVNSEENAVSVGRGNVYSFDCVGFAGGRSAFVSEHFFVEFFWVEPFWVEFFWDPVFRGTSRWIVRGAFLFRFGKVWL
jgi:hypothetical protein